MWSGVSLVSGNLPLPDVFSEPSACDGVDRRRRRKRNLRDRTTLTLGGTNIVNFNVFNVQSNKKTDSMFAHSKGYTTKFYLNEQNLPLNSLNSQSLANQINY